MKVLVVSHLYPTDSNPSSGIFVQEQVQELYGMGHSVYVISPTPYVPPFPWLPDR
jgi:hypothetical protein